MNRAVIACALLALCGNACTSSAPMSQGERDPHHQVSKSGCKRELAGEQWTPWDCSTSRLPRCSGPGPEGGEHSYPNGCVVHGSTAGAPEVYPSGSMYRQNGLFD
jgi:hypothetical protein